MDVEAFLHAVWDGRYLAPTYGSVEDLINFFAVKVNVAVPTATIPRAGLYSARLFLDHTRKVFVEVTRGPETRVFDFSSGMPVDIGAITPTSTDNARSSRRLLLGLKSDDFWSLEVGETLPTREVIPLISPEFGTPSTQVAFWQVYSGLTPDLELLSYQVSPIVRLLQIRNCLLGRVVMLNSEDVVYSISEQFQT